MNTPEQGGRERKEEKAMSLRKISKILGISPTYLSLLFAGKRPWRGNLKERYLELVNTFVNTQEANTAIINGPNGNPYLKMVERGTGIEPV